MYLGTKALRKSKAWMLPGVDPPPMPNGHEGLDIMLGTVADTCTCIWEFCAGAGTSASGMEEAGGAMSK